MEIGEILEIVHTRYESSTVRSLVKYQFNINFKSIIW